MVSIKSQTVNQQLALEVLNLNILNRSLMMLINPKFLLSKSPIIAQKYIGR